MAFTYYFFFFCDSCGGDCCKPYSLGIESDHWEGEREKECVSHFQWYRVTIACANVPCSEHAHSDQFNGTHTVLYSTHQM